MPSEIPSDLPSKMPQELPRQLPCESAREMPGKRPCEVHSETPPAIPEELPGENPCEILNELPREVLAEISSEVPSETSKEPSYDPNILAGLTESMTDLYAERAEGDFKESSDREVELAPKLEVMEVELTDLDYLKELDDSSGAVELVPTDLRVKPQEKQSTPLLLGTTIPVEENFSGKFGSQPRELRAARPASRESDAMQSPQPSGIPALAASREADAMQSPQPSGIPALPASPEPSKHAQFLERLLASPSPKMYTSEVTITKQQCEPLNLGKHRKSASPTITSCSDEIKPINNDFGEPREKKMKRESTEDLTKLGSVFDKPGDDYGQPKIKKLDPPTSKAPSSSSPLTQLQMLKTSRDFNIPDPLLVPKDKLNLIISAPATEIPALLIQRPELRLPEVFSYPGVLQDPDILVISLSQLESILENDAKKLEAEKNIEYKSTPSKHPMMGATEGREKEKSSKPQSDSTTHVKPIPSVDALAGDIDAATSAALNQMLWLPYLSQLEAMAACSQNMDFLKALNSSGYPPPNYSDLSQMFPSSRLMNPSGFPMMSQMDYENRMQFAMWQEAMNHANSASQRSRPASMDAQMKEIASKSTDVQNPYVHSTKSHQSKSHSAARTSPIAHNYSSNQRSMNHNPYLQGMYPGLNPTMRPNVPLPGLQIPYFNPNMMGSQRSPRTPQQKSPTSPFFQNNNYLQSLNQTEAPSQQQRSGSASSQESPRPRISVKSLHNLLEPTATGGGVTLRRTPTLAPGSLGPPGSLGRRRDEPEVGSTTPLGEAPHHGMPPHPHDPASFHLWHPLFGNHKSYNSPWSWTTVTATGD